LENIPDDIKVHFEVLVSKDVAQSCDLLPFDIWVRGSNRFRNRFGGFADDLQISNYGINGSVVLIKRVPSQTRRVVLNLAYSLTDIFEIDSKSRGMNRLL